MSLFALPVNRARPPRDQEIVGSPVRRSDRASRRSGAASRGGPPSPRIVLVPAQKLLKELLLGQHPVDLGGPQEALEAVALLGHFQPDIGVEPVLRGLELGPSLDRAVEVDLLPFGMMRRLLQLVDPREEDVDEGL